MIDHVSSLSAPGLTGVLSLSLLLGCQLDTGGRGTSSASGDSTGLPDTGSTATGVDGSQSGSADDGTSDPTTADPGTADTGTGSSAGDSASEGTTGPTGDGDTGTDTGTDTGIVPYGDCVDGSCPGSLTCHEISRWNATGQWCAASCQDASHCPLPNTGNVMPVCDGSLCKLPCGPSGSVCPDGMTCFERALGTNFCAWLK